MPLEEQFGSETTLSGKQEKPAIVFRLQILACCRSMFRDEGVSLILMRVMANGGWQACEAHLPFFFFCKQWQIVLSVSFLQGGRTFSLQIGCSIYYHAQRKSVSQGEDCVKRSRSTFTRSAINMSVCLGYQLDSLPIARRMEGRLSTASACRNTLPMIAMGSHWLTDAVRYKGTMLLQTSSPSLAIVLLQTLKSSIEIGRMFSMTIVYQRTAPSIPDRLFLRDTHASERERESHWKYFQLDRPSTKRFVLFALVWVLDLFSSLAWVTRLNQRGKESPVLNHEKQRWMPKQQYVNDQAGASLFSFSVGRMVPLIWTKWLRKTWHRKNTISIRQLILPFTR